jgi:hypothetical protein
MATVKGTTQTVIDTGGTGQAAGGLWRVKMKVTLDFYTIAGTEASGTLIKLFGAFPAGANLISCVLNFSAAQTSLTLSAGDADSATRYGSASTGPQTAGNTTFPLLGRVVGTSTNDNQLIFTTGGATATAATLFGHATYTEPAD